MRQGTVSSDEAHSLTQILIVDDDPGVSETVGKLLALQGREVVTAGSGAACLEVLRGGFRGVILMDIMMPGLSGWDTIRAIVAEKLTEGNVICMLTGKPSPGPEAEGLEEVVFDYLPKPFGKAALISMVDTAAAVLET